MYSKDIEDILHKKHISIGEKVLLERAEESFEGVLMPRPDAGDNNILVVKLSNGYNLGLDFRSISSIKRVGTSAETFSFPKIKMRARTGLKTVKLLYTGGTIGSRVDYATGGVYMLTKPEELLYDVPEMADIANIDVEHLMSVASEDMTYTEWQVMARKSAEAFNSGASGVIISHGTDTLHFSSAALSFMLQDLPGPVVLVGAQRSSDRGSSDAFMNLICSAHIAAHSDIAEVGTCMHASSSDDYCAFIRGTKVRKLHTSARDAFKPVNGAPIAKVNTEGNIRHLSPYTKAGKSRKVSLREGYEPRVAMLYMYPNSDSSLIDHYLDKGYKGLIIASTGLGHIPISASHPEYNWLQGVKDAVASGMVVGMTSQCLFGRVSGTVYRYGRMITDAGAIYCEDMMPEVAYVKLGWLLGNYGRKDAEKMLAANLLGEITPRTEAEWHDEV
ncbi:MAG: Glu-tRNA(Gln) amidotransferase subunit GatD [Candidatus Marsarchaeota archaeon]|nr:Glu-tRNA(Gln) amidotransferase subunit GatD [Candidatus Marsarchaeota archaeon]